jgi:hypothetical protein
VDFAIRENHSQHSYKLMLEYQFNVEILMCQPNGRQAHSFTTIDDKVSCLIADVWIKALNHNFLAA